MEIDTFNDYLVAKKMFKNWYNMNNFNISTKKLKKFIENKIFKILILAGKRSFHLSGLRAFFPR